MRGWTHTPIKTVNMSEDIFKDEIEPQTTSNATYYNRHTIDRKSIYAMNRKSMVQKYQKKLFQTLNQQQRPPPKDKKPYIPRQQSSKVKSQSKYSKNKYLSINTTLAATRTRNQHQHQNLVSYHFNNKRMLINNTTLMRNEDKQRSRVEGDGQKVDPYTLKKYRYIKNELDDHNKYIRKNRKTQEVVNQNFMSSYRVNTISLSPNRKSQKNKINVVIPTSRHHKTYQGLDPTTPQNNQQEGETLMPPSPWQWGQNSQSMGKDTITIQ